MAKREPTLKQKRAVLNAVENGGNVSKAMRDAKYSPATAKNPKKLTETKAWDALMKEYLPDTLLARKHKELLSSTRIEHLVFPVKTSDDDIRVLLSSVNCTVKKIQHGDTAKHVWFWAADNNALKNGLDLAYKLKGKYAPIKKDITSKGRRIKGFDYIVPKKKHGKRNHTSNKADTKTASSV